jgi:hypothetical protein
VPYEALVVADSINPAGVRLTTLQVRYPRMVHAELMTHRDFSRGTSSSRAIPARVIRTQVRTDPAPPVFWGANQKGMQAAAELSGWRLSVARWLFLQSRWLMLLVHFLLEKVGLHKQLTNRLLEPWMWVTVIVSSTQWNNFYALRCHKDAQPEIRRIALLMRRAMRASQPTVLRPGDWHRPYFTWRDIEPTNVAALSFDPQPAFPMTNYDLVANYVACGRCARVSYLTQDGRRDVSEDIALASRRLAPSGHNSPFEHVAMALPTDERCGNFRGWKQMRKFFPNEDGNVARWENCYDGEEELTN